MNTPFLLDDRDPSIQYSGKWLTEEWDPEYNITSTKSMTVGSNLTVPFYGTAIAVAVSLDHTSKDVVTSYSVDGGDSVLVTAPSVLRQTFNYTLWQSPDLVKKDHSLQIVMVKVNTGIVSTPEDPNAEGTIRFDYFAITNDTLQSLPNPTPSQTAIVSPSSISSVSLDATTTSNPSVTQILSTGSTSPTSVGAATTNRKSDLGAIVGGVIAALAIIVAFIFFLLWRRTRKRKREMSLVGVESFIVGSLETPRSPEKGGRIQSSLAEAEDGTRTKLASSKRTPQSQFTLNINEDLLPAPSPATVQTVDERPASNSALQLSPPIGRPVSAVSRAPSNVPTERQEQIRFRATELINRIISTNVSSATLLPRNISLDQLPESAREALHGALSENVRLREAIQWLMDQYNSDWALGLTDEPPPDYPL